MHAGQVTWGLGLRHSRWCRGRHAAWRADWSPL